MSDDAHFTTKLPTKRTAADCLITDDAGRLLVLDPPYKPTWDIPGGVVESDEAPRAAARREVREEIGLDLEPGQLLAVDWIARVGEVTEVIGFLFDGGALSAVDVGQIVVDPAEVRDYRFVLLDEAERLLDPELFARVVAGLEARGSGTTTYLENGHSPSNDR